MGIFHFSLFLSAVLAAIVCYHYCGPKWTISIIFVLALIPRLWLISNSTLGNNDEKYHALVAKHLSETPTKPTLYSNPVLPYNVNDYAHNHIWLSKPPVTMWLMATSIHLFGTNVIAVRLPSLLLSLISLFLIYNLGKKLFSEKTGLIAMFLLAIHGTYIELGAGEISSDHVDICFIVLFLLTVLLSVKDYQLSKNYLFKGMIIGALTGLMFLTKYQASFLIIPIWFYIFFTTRTSNYQFAVQVLMTVFSAAIISAPWIIHLYVNYPNEAKAMFSAAIKPMNEVSQGHSGPWYYYIDKVGKLFGEFIYLPIILLPFVWQKFKTQNLFIITIWIFIPLIGFSLIETKRFTYIMISAPAIFLLTGYFITVYLPQLKINHWIRIVVMIGLIALPIRFSIERVDYFTNRTQEFINEKSWIQALQNFSKTVDEEKTIVFGTEKYIETMFYSNCIAYPYLPNKQTIKYLQKNGYACYKHTSNAYLPIQ